MVTSRALLRFGRVVEQEEPRTAASERRVAVVLPADSRFCAVTPTSIETVVRTLALGLGDGNTRIFCSEGAAEHGVAGVECVPVGRGGRSLLLRQLAEYDPHIVEHHQRDRQASGIAAHLPDAAHILYRHTALKAPRNPLDAWRYHARLGRMDGFVFVSDAERRVFARTYPRFAHRAWAIPNPFDAGRWLAPPAERDKVIAFAGRAVPEKGLDVICAALPAVLDAHPAWRAVLMLNDWDRHGAWAAPHLAPLDRFGTRVVRLYSAPLQEVQQQMKRAAIALAPSMWAEPYGLAAIEAHAAGAALISSGRGGLREASGPHALFLDQVTAETLAGAIDTLILNPIGRQDLAAAAQAHVMAVHAPKARAQELARVRDLVWLRRRGST